MAYTKTNWVDRQVQRPLTFTMTNNSDGTVTLIPSEGLVTQSGTPLSADNLNHIEEGIAELDDTTVKTSGGIINGSVEVNGNLDTTGNLTVQSGLFYVQKQSNGESGKICLIDDINGSTILSTNNGDCRMNVYSTADTYKEFQFNKDGSFRNSGNAFVGGSLYLSHLSESERSLVFQNGGTGTYTHYTKIYGGNGSSAVALGAWDALNDRSIWAYLDSSNLLGLNAATTNIAGNLTFQGYIKATGSEGKIIAKDYRLLDSTGVEKSIITPVNGTSSGIGVMITGGGLTVVGSGESPDAYVSKYGYDGGNENTHLISDNYIYFGVTCNTIENTKRIIMNGSYFYPETSGAFSVGHTKFRFANGFFNVVYNSSGAITTSDRRYKNSEEIMSDKLINLFDLVPVKTFKYNDGMSNRTHSGIIAQDLLDGMDQLGITTTDFAAIVEDFNDEDGTSYYGVRYDEYHMLTAARLKKEIEDHKLTKEKLQELEDRTAQLEQIVAQLFENK